MMLGGKLVMCGRYALLLYPEFSERFEISKEDLNFLDRFNVCPSQHMPVIVHDKGSNRISLKQWGLFPFWARDRTSTPPMINARIEGILSKPSFRGPVRLRRCLVPATGFYEWRKDGSIKTPFHIRRKDGKPFAFAGIFDEWRCETGEVVDSYAILTTAPNSLMAPIHNRMPVILPQALEQEWLAAEGGQIETILASLVKPFNPDELDAYAVSREVNTPKSDFAALVDPVITS